MNHLLWFYRCPISAAWMQRYFDLHYVSGYSGKDFDEFLPIFNAGSPIKSLRENQQYYLHPNVVSVLDPIEGDIGYGYDPGAGNMYVAFKQGHWRWINSATYQVVAPKFRLSRIVERNSVTFHMPIFDQKIIDLVTGERVN
jgi:hypothetical protein